MIEDVVVDGLSMTIDPGGGRRRPLFGWGMRFRHTTLRGRLGSLILNQPYGWIQPRAWPTDGLEDVRRYYDQVDWALDISSAVFTSVPSVRFGPPAELVRIDPESQAIVTRKAAEAGDWRRLPEIGVWRVVIQDLLDKPWPDTALLVAARGGSRTELERDLRALAALRRAGIAK